MSAEQERLEGVADAGVSNGKAESVFLRHTGFKMRLGTRAIHIKVCDDARQDIVADDKDWSTFLGLLAHAMDWLDGCRLRIT